MFICGGRRLLRPLACLWCSYPHTKLCDFPVKRNGKWASCDHRICDSHATTIRPNVDYCPDHKGASLAL